MSTLSFLSISSSSVSQSLKQFSIIVEFAEVYLLQQYRECRKLCKSDIDWKKIGSLKEHQHLPHFFAIKTRIFLYVSPSHPVPELQSGVQLV